MAVVTTSMHGLWLLARPVLAGCLADGQAVHVGADADGRALAIGERRDETTADVIAELEAEVGEDCAQLSDGAGELEADFGSLMKFAPPGDDLGDCFHGRIMG